MQSVAIIGSGMGGMSAAHYLHKHFNITLFEQRDYVGGHTRTEVVPDEAGEVPVDTGFMVYNEATYPLLTRLFDDLNVPTNATDMSFGVNHVKSDFEYSGSSLSGLFAKRSNLARPKFWKFIQEILRFNRIANRDLKANNLQDVTLNEYTRIHRLSDRFLHQYLVPMTSAIWSTPPGQMLDFPAKTLIRFMYNHGLLGVTTQHQWRTVTGGSREYRDRIIAPFRDRIKKDCPIRGVRRIPGAVELVDAKGKNYRFSRVIIATHADQALALLQKPTAQEESLLTHFSYSPNQVTLHTDLNVMPRRRKAWSSWNYRMDHHFDPAGTASTHYWMNRLQQLNTDKDIFVSVNGADLIDQSKIIKQFTFDHPVFDAPAIKAQKSLPQLNENGKIYFCGSYFRYGFHEDALMAGKAAATKLMNDFSTRTKLAV